MTTEINANFELASIRKFRFTSPIGLLTVEDLWDLPLEAKRANEVTIDTVAIALHQEITSSQQLSFVKDKKVEDVELQAKMDIVLHIIEKKKEKAEALVKAKARKQRIAKFDMLIAEAEDKGLREMSVDELKALREAELSEE